jgi:hypothetical protein
VTHPTTSGSGLGVGIRLAVSGVARNEESGRHVFCPWRICGWRPCGRMSGGMGQQKSPSKDFQFARAEMLILPG